MIQRTLSGITYLGYGFRWLLCPNIRWLVILPLLINIGVFIGAIGLLLGVLNPYITDVMQHIPPWLHSLVWVLKVALLAALIVPVYWTFAVIGNLIAAPFLSVLAERVAQNNGDTSTTPQEGWRSYLAMVPRTLHRELQKIRYYLPRFLGLLCLSFVPIVQLAATPVLLLFSAWMMTLQYVDYAADYQGIPFAQMLPAMRAHRVQSLSFGGATLVLMMIPGLNLMMMPVAVIGGTRLWFQVLNAQVGTHQPPRHRFPH